MAFWDIFKKKKTAEEETETAEAQAAEESQETALGEEGADTSGEKEEEENAPAPAEEQNAIPVPEVLPEEEAAEAAEELTEDAEEEQEEKPKKKGFFARLKEGLKKTRENFVYSLDVVFDGAEAIDDDFFDELEETLIMGDMGAVTTERLLDKLRDAVDSQAIVKPSECKGVMIEGLREQMHVEKDAYRFENEPSVVFVIGVNGVGKTTTIGKLASQLKKKRKKVLIAAADTFRAAAGDQLQTWADRAGVEMIGGVEGADPASVLFDAVHAAKARKTDVLLVDTAGRLNNKKNLMEELKKMNRVIDREYPDAYRENLIVLDATTGQNAMQQARDFNDVADLSGIVLTKMDGTAKGGIAVAIQSELKIPVKYIGVGEKIDDLQKFDPESFVEALFETEG
ncbi:MAG: signal recognition particle-docking protein FtsY [Lachnospiraceae bacterium]|nr:signal recognition particle-docking protein FtsY [Lachnospiraceae bacterium]